MNLMPHSEVEVTMAHSVMPGDHPTATHPAHVEAETPARIARRLYTANNRTAFLSCTDGQLCIAIARVLADAGLRIGEALDRHPERLAEVRAELRRLCEAAIAAPFDPEHIRAVQAEGRNCARQMGGVPAAAAEAAE